MSGVPQMLGSCSAQLDRHDGVHMAVRLEQSWLTSETPTAWHPRRADEICSCSRFALQLQHQPSRVEQAVRGLRVHSQPQQSIYLSLSLMMFAVGGPPRARPLE